MIDNLTEAISHAKEVAKANRDKAESYNRGEDYEQIKAYECVSCADEHEQLADWLTELKQRREQDKKGEWKIDEYGLPYCNKCNKHPDATTEFCPFCGADMRGSAE